jgi:hypothetical protein
MGVENMPDERLQVFYENIRQQIEADRGFKHRLTSGTAVRQYASQIQEEMVKRRLRHAPIDWLD